jgi:uncharacterized protein YbaR (Trm112 family)
MEPNLKQRTPLDATVVSLLACPACRGDLRLEDTGSGEARLVCAACARGYPIVDGIPVLIAERAESPRN